MNETSTLAVNDAAPTVGSRVPGRRWWILWTVLVVLIGITRHPDFPDRGTANVVLLICSGLIVFSFLFWMIRFGCCPRLGKWLLGLCCLGAVAAPAVFRIESWRGALQPVIQYRWQPAPAEEVHAIKATEQSDGIDLSVTSESDFPQFLGPNRDNTLPNVQLKRDWSTPPEMLWKQPIGAGWSGFAAVNGYAITLEQRGPMEILACYEIVTGKAAWTQEVETRHETSFGHVGPRSTPTIHNGLVYVMGGTGHFRCVDGTTGEVIWSHDLFEELGMDQATAEKPVPWGRAASPLIVDNMVIIPVGGPSGGPFVTLAAYDATTGDEIWKTDGYQISYASPQLMTLGGVRQVVIVNENFVTSHRVDNGQLLWEHPWKGLSNMNASSSQPKQVGNDQVFLSKGYSVGSELIQVSNPGEGEWPTESLWTSRTLKTKFSNASFLDGYAYGLDEGVLACQELATGKRQWKRGRYGFGQTLLVGDTLLVLDEDGAMHMVAATPEQHTEFGEFQAIEGMTWNTFCLYGDLLLVRNAKEAACFRLPLR